MVSVLCACGASACMWDRDTLAEEAKGRPETVRIIVGWFDQHPPRYFEMRLERVAREIESSPDDLGLYDDAAVACDRLGRHDEAIAWMEKKKAVLDALPAGEAKEHRYRYLANLGTFLVHQWISQPADVRNADLAPLRQGEKLIAKAIEENPDAHFGREVYQLHAIRWMLDDGADDPDSIDYSRTGWVTVDRFPTRNPETDEHVAGIAGLIQLGAAWNSLDAFHTLTAILDAGEYASLAELSYHREMELVGKGAGSIHPVAAVRERIVPARSRTLKDRDPVSAYYPVARQAAMDRNKAWIEYQSERFRNGMHPDTHPDFWDSWVEPPFPTLPGPSMLDRFVNLFGKHPLAALFGLVAGITLAVLIFLRSVRRIVACYQAS